MDKIGLRQVLPDVFADNPPVGSEIWRRDVTFDKGRVYLVEAASGSGKSSFCGYLYGYRRDYSGTILFGRNECSAVQGVGGTLLSGTLRHCRRPAPRRS